MKYPFYTKQSNTKICFILFLLVVITACSDKGEDPPQRPGGDGVVASIIPGLDLDFTQIDRVEKIVGATPADVEPLSEKYDWEWDAEECRLNLLRDHGYPLYLNIVGLIHEEYGAVSTLVKYAGDEAAANGITSLAVSMALESGLPLKTVVNILKAQFDIKVNPFEACLSADRDASLTQAMKALSSNFTAETSDAALLLIHSLDREKIYIDPAQGFPAAIAGLAYDPGYGYIPLDITFFNMSVGDIDSFAWDFGDSQTSQEKNPTHGFENPGRYIVKHTVTAPDGEQSTADAGIYAFTSSVAPPSVTLTVSPDNGDVPLAVAFEAQADGTVLDFVWDFGDDTTFTGINPIHTFSTPGRHTAVLTVMGEGGAVTARKVIHAGKFTAAVATAATDFSSGAHTIVNVDSLQARKNILPTTSDITMVAHGSYFYRIERYLHDNVAKFSIAEPATAIWQYSALEPVLDGASTNPYDIVFVNDRKAYLIRYGSPRAWIINPSATHETAFKTGELDLSVYGDQDGIPEMAQGVLVGEKLYIVMQRMDRTHTTGIWQPNRAYVAVFDTNNNSEIDTGYGQVNEITGKALKGIPLTIENPITTQFLPENHTIYIQGVGIYPMTGFPGKDTGGIESVDPESYETLLVLDDGERLGEGDELPWGNISGMVMVSPEKGYFVGYSGWNDNSLYAFQLNDAGQADTGSITLLDYLSGKNITVMEAGVGLDNKGRLWVSNRTDTGIVIIDPETDLQLDFVNTGLPPLKTVFCYQ